jgi:hypothetical protein
MPKTSCLEIQNFGLPIRHLESIWRSTIRKERQSIGQLGGHLTIYPVTCQGGLGHHRSVPLPPIASFNWRSPLAWLWISAALTIEDDHLVANIPTVNTSQNWDPASSLIGHLRYSQSSTAGALHSLSLLHNCQLRGLIHMVGCGWTRSFLQRSALELFTNRHSDLADWPELKIPKQSMKAASRLVEIYVVTEF